MTVNQFRQVVKAIRPFTGYVYLHVLGEPLLHPRLHEVLQICKEHTLGVNITTNGSLLMKKKDVLSSYPVRQINVSLHDAEENIPKEQWADFIKAILQTADELSKNVYINLRLWNQEQDKSHIFNTLCVDVIKEFFPLFENNGRNITLGRNVFLQTAPRFEWIEGQTLEHKTCYALKDHIAILSDGSVVPCCMDADAHLLLGNIFTDNLADILQSEKVLRIKNGFAQHRAVEEYCKKCGFRK